MKRAAFILTLVVSTTSLIAQKGAKDNGFDQEQYEHHELTKTEVSLGDYVIDSPNSVIPDFMTATGTVGNEVYLGFQQEHDAIILKLDEAGQSTGDPIELSGYWLSQIRCLTDGSILVAAGKANNNTYLKNYPNTLYLFKFDSNGKKLFKTKVFGGEGHGPGKSWFDGRSQARITTNGDEIGIYFEVQKNWAKSGEDIHNGDMFVVTDSDGEIKEDRTHFWTASHSSTVQVCAESGGDFYTMTIGDAHPYGLQLYNRNTSESFIPYPPKEEYLSYSEVESTNAAGLLRYADENDGNLVAILGSTENPNIGVFTKVDPLFLLMDKQGNVLTKKWLKQSDEVDESRITVDKIGGNYLVAWGEGNVYEDDWAAGNVEIMILSPEGKELMPPVELEGTFCSSSQVFAISETTFCWFEVAYNGSKTINLYTATFSKTP